MCLRWETRMSWSSVRIRKKLMTLVLGADNEAVKAASLNYRDLMMAKVRCLVEGVDNGIPDIARERGLIHSRTANI